MYGPRASRLHDELVAVTARWADPTTRKEPLKPYAEDSEEKTLKPLGRITSRPPPPRCPDQVKHKLANSAERM